MGTGTDVAIESAGITLVKGDLRGIVRARRLSRATMRNIRQNLFLAFVYNAVGVPVAAGVLYPLHRDADQPDLGQRGDDVQLGVGDCQRAPAETRRAVRGSADAAHHRLTIERRHRTASSAYFFSAFGISIFETAMVSPFISPVRSTVWPAWVASPASF